MPLWGHVHLSLFGRTLPNRALHKWKYAGIISPGFGLCESSFCRQDRCSHHSILNWRKNSWGDSTPAPPCTSPPSSPIAISAPRCRLGLIFRVLTWHRNETKSLTIADWFGTWFSIMPTNKLVSLTWLLWVLIRFRRFTLHYISLFLIYPKLWHPNRSLKIPETNSWEYYVDMCNCACQ